MILLNHKKNFLELKIENTTDYWYLSKIISTNDIVKGAFERKIKINDNSVKKKYFGIIKVEKIEYDEKIRINGTIQSEHEEIPKGSYQAISFEINDIIKIEKNNLLKFHLDLIKKSHKVKDKLLVIAFDRDEAYFFEVEDNQNKLLFNLKGNPIKKEYESESSNFYSEIISETKKIESNYKLIIFSSPSFFKEYLIKLLDEKLKQKSFSVGCSTVHEKSILEILKQQELEKILGENDLKNDLEILNKALVEINKDGNVAYGLNDIKNISNTGAINILLVTEKLLEEKREEIEEILDNIEKTNGEIRIINSKNDAGIQLDGLGGIISLLNYKIK
ncbi:MAG: hypothetical protein PHT94_01755 [Candidatus Nanoarchaeia archaeon]|nr:hypothetical protein [Candidatus Nanoarchaeia archaeon]